jgi:Tfp pilus assembly protein PilN
LRAVLPENPASEALVVVITKLNLSTHPFRNRNLPYLLTVLLLGLSVGGAIYCFGTLRANSVRDEEYRGKISTMESDIQRLKNDGLKIQQQLTPDQQNLVGAAHKLVDSKNFVWSRLFSDLENVMPGSVSASRIAVKDVFSDGNQVRAELDFAVLARDYSAVDSMIASMNNSGLFQAEIRGQGLQKTERLTFSEYTLRVVYTPTYRLAAGPVTDIAQNSEGGAQ